MSSEGPYGRQGFQSNPSGYGGAGNATYGGGGYSAPQYGYGGASYSAPSPQGGAYGGGYGAGTDYSGYAAQTPGEYGVRVNQSYRVIIVF